MSVREIHFRNPRGLPLRLSGEPEPVTDPRAKIERITTRKVGVLGVGDFPGLRPAIEVQQGDKVQRGQTLWSDKNNPALKGTAPASGEVLAIHRGLKRALLSVEMARSGEQPEEAAFRPMAVKGAAASDKLRERLIAGGLWSAFRERPYDRVPAGDSRPAAILVTALDDRPLAADPTPLLSRHQDALVEGLHLLLYLTAGPVLVCTGPDAEIPFPKSSRLVHVKVRGPYPAGLPGTLLHHLQPPTPSHRVWYIDWQDLIQCADLVHRGQLPKRRYVSLGGGFERPRLVELEPGADLTEAARKAGLAQPPAGQSWRLVSGSPLFGHGAEGATSWLGRWHNQACALVEGGESQFLNWMQPGLARYSRMPVFASHWFGRKPFRIAALRNGGERGLIPVEVYDDAMPLEVPVVPLLKALLVGDIERAQALGCLELGEEDLATCTFICPSKYDYGAALRHNLDRLEREG